MKLQSRLKLTSAVTIACVAVSIGGFAIVRAHQVTLTRIDQGLNSIVTAASANKQDPLSEALVATSDTNLTLAYVSLDRNIIVIKGSSSFFKAAPNDDLLKQATSEAVTSHGAETTRIRTMARPDNEYIVVAQSLKSAQNQDQGNIKALLAFVIFASACGALIVGRMLKRDFNEVDILIQNATEISQGNTDVHIMSHSGNSEIDELAQALDRMVTALQSSVDLERSTHNRMQEFLGDASHELRTPLTVIKGYVELMSQDPHNLAEPYSRYFTRVTHEIERMEALIKDLLLLAELGDQGTTSHEPVALSDLVSTQVQDLQELAPERLVTASVGPQIIVMGSTSLLQQLLANLFSNIRRHTPANAPVEVRLTDVQGEVQLTIDDGGPGLPESSYHQDSLHFKRFDPSRSRESGGSGLGMSIVAAIVRTHNGELTLGPSHLGGLRTTITLPSTDRLEH